MLGAFPITYQWHKDGHPLSDGGNIAGSRTPELTINSAQLDQGGSYSLTVENSRGTRTSTPAVVTVVPFYRPPGTELWSFPAGNEIIETAAIGPDKTIYVSATDEKLYALNPEGKQLWTYSFPSGGRLSAPSVALDGTIYAGIDWPGNSFVALTPGGQLKWQFPEAGTVRLPPAVAFDGKVYVSANDGTLYALSPSGEKIWAKKLSQPVYLSPAAIGEDGTIYVGGGHPDPVVGNTVGDFYALTPDGETKWHFTARGPFSKAPALGTNGIVYFGTFDNEGAVYALDRTGKQIWQHKVGASIGSSPVLGSDGSIYFSRNDGMAYALLSNGTRKWTTSGQNTAAVGADGVIYFPQRDGSLKAVSSAGKELWGFELSMWGMTTVPVLTSEGIIYVAAGSKLFAVQASAPLASSHWPMFQRDPRHSGNKQTLSAPIISITAPHSNSTFRTGEPISISANIFGGNGAIQKVQYFANGSLIKETSAAPYSITWSNHTAGIYALGAVAIDTADVAGNSGEVTIIINDPPVVSVIQPPNQSVYWSKEDILLEAGALDPNGRVAKLEFYEGNRLLGTVTETPFRFLWKQVPPGIYEVIAKAYDDLNGVGTSRPAVLRVNAPPTAQLAAPVDGAQFNEGQPVNISLTASDVDGEIIQVELFNGSTRLAFESNTESLSFLADQLAPGEHVFIGYGIDNDGEKTATLPVTVRVVPTNPPPVGQFNTPFDGQTIFTPGVMTISVNSSDPGGQVARTELFSDNLLLSSWERGGLLAFSWTNPPAGEHLLGLRVIDSQGRSSSNSLRVKTTSNQGLSVPLPSSLPRTNHWTPDGPVHTMIETNGVLYIGGAFQNIGQFVPGHAVVELSSTTPDLSYPGADILIDALLDDGKGGFYVSGLFHTIGNTPKRGIAHIHADKSVDLNFGANANGHVLVLALDGDTLYAGGEFDEIAGVRQRYVAALDAKTGALKPWNPEPTGSIHTIAITNSTVYLGGDFEYVGGRYRNRLAAVDKSTGLSLAWNPNADKWVSNLLIADGKLYVTGEFGTIAGQVRNGLAAFDLGSGALDGFNSNGMGGARDLAFEGGILYVGGAFGVYAVNTQTGASVSQNMQVNGAVNSIAVLGQWVYLAGEFSSVNGMPRNKVAAIDRATGSVSSLDLNPSGRFDLVARVGQKVLGAGTLGLIKVQRRGLAAIDTATGFATSWNADCDGIVHSLAAGNGQLYVGGQFETLGGARRISLGSVDLKSGKVSSWRPNTTPQSTTIHAMVLLQETILVGGYFNVLNGENRGHLAELDLRTGDLTRWNPQADDLIYSLAIQGDIVYVGGDFQRISNQERSCIAAVNRYTGQLTAWNPGANRRVRTIIPAGKTIYLSGSFETLGGTARSYAGAVDADTGKATPWICNLDGGAPALEKVNDVIFVGGQFTQVNGVRRINAAAVHTGLAIENVLAWMPEPGNEANADVVFKLLATDASVYIGGRFKTAGATSANNLAVFDYPTRIENPLKLPDGLFRLSFHGPLGYYYVFEKSLDLQTWTPVLTNRPPFIFEDAHQLNNSAQFYRARPLR